MAAATPTYSLRNGLIKYGTKVRKSSLDELQGILDREVWEGMHYSNISPTQRKQLFNAKCIITSKENEEGVFVKIKAQLVALGDLQTKD